MEKEMINKKHSCSVLGNFALREFKEFLKDCKDKEPLKIIMPCGCSHEFTRESIIALLQLVEDEVFSE